MDIDFVKIKSLREEINRLLEERPQYRALQDALDSELSKCGTNKHNRCVVAIDFMMRKWKEIFKANDGLQKECQNLKELLNNVK